MKDLEKLINGLQYSRKGKQIDPGKMIAEQVDSFRFQKSLENLKRLFKNRISKIVFKDCLNTIMW